MEPRSTSGSVSHWIASIVQNIGTIFFRVLFHSFFKIKIHGAERLKKARGPALLISNHIAPYDSFMFHLFFRLGSPLLPLRFMGVLNFHSPVLNFFSRIGVIPLIYLLFGVFVIVQGQGAEKALVNARRILKQGGTVVIFPEGKISRDGQISEFKKGAAMLALETGVQVIPISVKKTKKTFRSMITIRVGESIYFNEHGTESNPDEAIEKTSKSMREAVTALHSIT